VLRRVLAVVLVLIAGIIALGPQRGAEAGTPVVVLTRDLPIGATIADGDVEPARQTHVPDGVIGDASTVVGRVLAGPTRRGEVLTDVRLADTDGPDPGPGRVAVPVHPADPAIVDLLGPGMHVAVIAVAQDGSSELLAPDAVVLSIAPGSARGHDDRPVVLAVPAESADRIAATALAGTIAVRFT
jgi:pilus assembly protein CpaB